MEPGVNRIIKNPVNTYVVHQGHKARTWVMHLKFVGNVSLDTANNPTGIWFISENDPSPK
jgi:hypothetical protein